ncbi:hypothetical protein LJR045_001616 [Microbacterium sp. LjRoot45]|uniref:hypothetical protein n=1 Tax=Microbacterium sp. LjRoot45 TaxID=3342329 RepID=UPI003ECD8F88
MITYRAVASAQSSLGVRVVMRFSEHFGVTPTADDDWLDPHLTVDTKLFIDPFSFLEEGECVSAHEQTQHFEGGHRSRSSTLMDRNLPDWRLRGDGLNRSPLDEEEWDA